LLSDCDLETFEYCDPTDGETEKEEEKNDKKDEFRLEFMSSKSSILYNINSQSNAYFLQSLYHPETITPPPERS